MKRALVLVALASIILPFLPNGLWVAIPTWIALLAVGYKVNKPFTLYFLSRVADALIVLFAVLIITVAMFGGTIAQIKKQMIIDSVKREVMSNPKLAQQLGPKLKQYIQETAEKLIKAQGLDKPWYMNLPNYLTSVITLDLQSQVLTSNSGSRLVRDIVMERLPRTVLLFTTATIITIIIGVLLGLAAAKMRGSIFDKVVTVFALVTASFPMWWVGMLMLQIFSYQLNLFPSGGMVSVPPPKQPLAYLADLLWHMALPVITIVLVSFGGWAYVTRNILLGVMKEDFVLAARARGLLEKTVLFRHVLRPSLPPIVTMMALSIVASLSGAIITEIVFNWPGMGMLYWEAIETLDIPVILGLTYIFTLVFVVAMLILDIVYAVLDPRVRKR